MLIFLISFVLIWYFSMFTSFAHVLFSADQVVCSRFIRAVCWITTLMKKVKSEPEQKVKSKRWAERGSSTPKSLCKSLYVSSLYTLLWFYQKKNNNNKIIIILKIEENINSSHPFLCLTLRSYSRLASSSPFLPSFISHLLHWSMTGAKELPWCLEVENAKLSKMNASVHFSQSD